MKTAIRLICWPVLCALLLPACSGKPSQNGPEVQDVSPRLLNIIHFVRQTDFRVENSDKLMYETVCEQLRLINRYHLPATFLLEYDALVNPAYQKLLKDSLNEWSEIGAWWEITQPHAEAAGVRWRGRHSWDYTADVAFSVGYTREERKRLVDAYMKKFKEVFGTCPKSVGSWYIDAYSLAYMHDKYAIDASCNCRDQIGTDGYTLWGGYWNQAYYPSRENAYMPAQHEENQINVPVFRMLGSDPIYQYDGALGENGQDVMTLEPYYEKGGKSRKWVDYFFDALVNQPCLAYSYAQAGQENSFLWYRMKEGLEMQYPLIDSLRNTGKVRVETLGESGRWFKMLYDVTPPTAVTAVKDWQDAGNRTVWFDSRFYRANLLWEKNDFRIRDIHLFDEKFRSSYQDSPEKGRQFFLYTLPVVEGFLWSDADSQAGLRLVALHEDGTKESILLGEPEIEEKDGRMMVVTCKDRKERLFSITLQEEGLEIRGRMKETPFRWALELQAADDKEFPFVGIKGRKMCAVFRDYAYSFVCEKGIWDEFLEKNDAVFRIYAEDGCVRLNFSGK